MLRHHKLFIAETRPGILDIDDLLDPLVGRPGLLDRLEDSAVSLAVTGHNHWPGVSWCCPLTKFGSAATCSIPQYYLILPVEPTGTTVELVPRADSVAFEEASHSARAVTPCAPSIGAAFHSGYSGEFPSLDDCPNADNGLWHQGVLKRLVQ